MADHENLQAVAAFGGLAFICFFGFLSIPSVFTPPLNWILAITSVIVVLIVALVYFARHKNEPLPPPIVQNFIQNNIQNFNVRIDGYRSNPVQSSSDGVTNYAGSVYTGSHTANPMTFNYSVYTARDGNIITNQSSVTRINTSGS